MNVSEPQSQVDIVSALEQLRTEGLRFWATLAPDRFATPFGEAWSPADNLRHLIKSTTPVARALAVPAETLQTMFGVAEGPSASYVGLRDRYRSLLVGGVDAGEFAPSKIDVPADHAAWQFELVSECAEALKDLATVAARWNEGDLDTYRLPHPLLGMLTVREMLLFTIYHYSHHRENVARRLASEPGPPN